MADRRPSFQELLADFSEEVFVGRRRELELFEGALEPGSRPFLVLSIWGQGGVGKSSLIERFKRVAAEHGAASGLADHDQLGVPATLGQLARGLRHDGVALKTFDELDRKYRKLREAVESDPSAPPGLLDFLVRNAASMAVRSTSLVPILGEAKDVVLGPDAEAKAAEYASAVSAYIVQKLKRDEAALLANAERVLTEAVLADLGRPADRRSVVLIFDAYEQTAQYLDRWLRDLLVGSFGEFSSDVLFVISGQQRLGKDWRRFQRAIRELELSVFEDDEAREYLDRFGITEDAHVAELLEQSSRLPVMLALLASGGASVGEAAGDAVERFLQAMTSEQRDAALLASVPRVFEEDVLGVLLGDQGRGRAAFDWLSRASFVRAGKRGWSYHEVVRPLMLKHLRRRSPARFAEAHSRLASHYETRCAALALPEGERWADERLLGLQAERFYHQLSSEPRMGVALVVSAALNELDAGGERMRRYAGLLEQVGSETDDAGLTAWSTDLQRLAIREDEVDSSRTLLPLATKLCGLDGLDAAARARAFALRADLHLEASDPATALADLDAAEELDPLRARIHVDRARAHLIVDDVQAGIAALTRATELEPEDAALRALLAGVRLFRADDTAGAIADFDRVIELAPAGYHAARGIAYMKAGEHELALADFDAAIRDQPEFAHAYVLRSQMLLALGREAEALASLDRALALEPVAIGYRNRADVRVGSGDVAGALRDLDIAIELDPNDPENYLARARLREGAGQLDAAEADYDAAVRLEPSARTLGLRSFFLFSQGRLDEVLRDVTGALVFDPDNAALYQVRGRAEYRRDRLREAEADLTRAIELDPENAERRDWRGVVRMATDDLDGAMEDFDRAIELDPTSARAFFHRAGVEALCDRWEESWADFDRSIALGGEPEDRAIALASRGARRLEEGDPQAAWADFDEALELAPVLEMALPGRAKALIALGENAAALADLDRLLELDPDKADARVDRAACLLGLSRVAEAREELGRARELEPENAAVAYNLACCSAREGDAAQAFRWLRIAVEGDPSWAEHAGDDPDLESIRDEPAFEEIVGAVSS
jgi:tetratricopeptide (TPR) repeat protein